MVSSDAGPAEVLGVAGAGTMGTGIAQVALSAGLRVILHDPAPGALERAAARIADGLRRAAASDLLRDEPEAILARLQPAPTVDALAAATFVIEAVPEDPEVKERFFRDLSGVLPPDAVVASNTSSLPIARLAAATGRPDRALGLHFFNPVPAMRLVEVIPGPATSPRTLSRALALARALGKTPVIARDGPGFIVNRLARPFYLEALRLAGEGVAAPADIDRLIRAAGFRMGPFELMDLIGIDVNYAVSRSVHEQLHGEPRLRPHPIQAAMIHAGRLGRKTGAGFYRYGGAPGTPQPDAGAARSAPAVAHPDPARRAPPGPLLILATDPADAEPLVRAAGRAGHALHVEVVAPPGPVTSPDLQLSGHAEAAARTAGAAFDLTWLDRRARRALAAALDRLLPPEAPLVVAAATVTATEIAAVCRDPRRVAGLGGFPPYGAGEAVELVLPVQAGTWPAPGDPTGLPWAADAPPGEAGSPVPAPDLPPAALRAAALAEGLGYRAVFVADGTAGVTARILACLANEAAFALAERVASAEAMDLAMRLGANWPEGPLALSRRLGPSRVVAVLEHLAADLGPDRYRPAPLLRRWAAAGGLPIAPPAPEGGARDA